MSIAQDAVGPSSSGQSGTSITSISWSHTCTGSNLIVFVGVAGPNIADTVTCKYGTTSMTLIGKVNSNNQTSGGVWLWGLIAPPTGATTITVSDTSGSTDMEGGSVSYTGADQTTGWKNATTNYGAPSSGTGIITGTIASVAAGDWVVAACSYGSPISGISTGTSRWLDNQNGNTAAGNGAMGDINASGSVSVKWSSTSGDWFGWVGCEIIAASGATAKSDTDSANGVETTGPVGVSSADAGTGAGTGQVEASAGSTDSGSGAGAGSQVRVSSPDAGTGQDAGAVRAQITSGDAGSGAGSAGPVGVGSAEDVTGSSGYGPLGVECADAGTGSGSQSVNTNAGTAKSSSDSGHGQEGDIEPAADADTATGSDGGEVVQSAVADADAATGSDTGSAFWHLNYVYGSDAATGSEDRNATARTIFLSETAAGADDQGTQFTFSLADSAAGADSQSYEVIVFPFPPPWLFKSGGGADRYRIIFRPRGGTALHWVHEDGRQEVLRVFDGSLGAETDSIGRLLERLDGSDSVHMVGDGDCGFVAEWHRPTAHVDQLVTGRMP